MLCIARGRSNCREKLLQASHTLCLSHNQERKKLHASYKLKEKYDNSLQTKEGKANTKEKIKAKLAAGKETLELRDQVNRRVFNFFVQNRGHIKGILKLQSTVRCLEQQLAGQNAENRRKRSGHRDQGVPITSESGNSNVCTKPSPTG
jgi:hypothetical protein